MSPDDDEKEGMDTSGEIRRKALEEAARERAAEQERERLRILEAERQREAERRRRDD